MIFFSFDKNPQKPTDPHANISPGRVEDQTKSLESSTNSLQASAPQPGSARDVHCSQADVSRKSVSEKMRMFTEEINKQASSASSISPSNNNRAPSASSSSPQQKAASSVPSNVPKLDLKKAEETRREDGLTDTSGVAEPAREGRTEGRSFLPRNCLLRVE